MVTQTELDVLETRMSEIKASEAGRSKAFFGGLTLFFTLQFGISYYAIFVVPWLGWDLVEPLTYTVTQGSFILGLFYIMRNRGFNCDFTSMDENMMMGLQQKWKTRYNFDIQRYLFLTEKVNKIEMELRQALGQRIR